MSDKAPPEACSQERLEVVINNSQPVLLSDLTSSLFALSSHFHDFVAAESPRHSDVKGELYVKDVRSGSIIVELVAYALPVLPMLWNGGAIVEWANYTKDLILWLLEKGKKPDRTITPKELDAIGDIIAPIANDEASQINFNATQGGHIIVNMNINAQEAKRVQRKIQREKAALAEPASSFHEKRVMTWHQAKFEKNAKTGNRANIDSIYSKSLKVLFKTDAIREQMYEQGVALGKPWHELAYIVDVEVQTAKGIPTVATILDFYPDETFDPQEPRD